MIGIRQYYVMYVEYYNSYSNFEIQRTKKYNNDFFDIYIYIVQHFYNKFNDKEFRK